jgi:hypothetical protein
MMKNWQNRSLGRYQPVPKPTAEKTESQAGGEGDGNENQGPQ